jgi:hypothetical protein
MGVYTYIVNETKNERVCLGKQEININIFLEYFKKNNWSVDDKFISYDDSYSEETIHIMYKNNQWIFYYPPRDIQILGKYDKDGNELITDIVL